MPSDLQEEFNAVIEYNSLNKSAILRTLIRNWLNKKPYLAVNDQGI